MTSRTGVGVDWASGSWVAIAVYAEKDPRAWIEPNIANLVDTVGEDTRIVADVPIGLCSGSDLADCDCACQHDQGECSRRVDSDAREMISPRASSVFTPPCREVVSNLDQLTYQEANETNRERTGKGLMQQAYYIADGIAEVDAFLRRDDIATDRILEGHPEVCFRAFGEDPLRYSKLTALGAYERLDRLQQLPEYSSGDWQTAARMLTASTGEGAEDVDLDDLLDAFALALTAVADENLERLPTQDDQDSQDGDYPPVDDEGLPMQMVYRER